MRKINKFRRGMSVFNTLLDALPIFLDVNQDVLQGD